MTSLDIQLGVETLTRWVRQQQRAISLEAQALGQAQPADAVSRLLVGLLFSVSGYLALSTATDVSGVMVVGWDLAGRVAVGLTGVVFLRYGGPRVVSGLRTIKDVRAGDQDDDGELEDQDDTDRVADRRKRGQPQELGGS